MFLRMSQTSIDERKRLVAKANEAMRNLPRDFHRRSSEKQALSKQASLCKVGVGEPEMIEWLTERGCVCKPQSAFGAYNIDILIGNIAVEIHVNPSNPHRNAYYRNRIIKLLGGGLSVIYIKVTKQRRLSPDTADSVIAILKHLCGSPPARREYWMIRGDGQFAASMCLDYDQSSLVPIAGHGLNAA